MAIIPLARKLWPPHDRVRSARLADLIRSSPEIWNIWRKNNPSEEVDIREEYFVNCSNFQGIDLHGANLCGCHFSQSDLRGANLSAVYAKNSVFQGADLTKANMHGSYFDGADLIMSRMRGADLRAASINGSSLSSADLSYSNLRGAKLSGASAWRADFTKCIVAQADMTDASLRECIFREAVLEDTDISGANLVAVDFTNAKISRCRVYGTSVWDALLDNCKQEELIITESEEMPITVDNIRVAQFIYMLLRSSEVRDMIDTVTSKAVLIIGRFTDERMVTLNAIRNLVRKMNYVPVLFDFERPVSRTFIETITTLASMARFIIADLTDAKVVLQELQAIAKDLPSVPVQPLIKSGHNLPVTLVDFYDYPWFLPVHVYNDDEHLENSLALAVIQPAEAYAKTVRERRSRSEEMIRNRSRTAMRGEE